MSRSRPRLERIAGRQQLEQFDCGRPELDDWLRRHALDNDARDLSRVYVAVLQGGEVAGYIELHQSALAVSELPARRARGLPRQFEAVGAVVIGRLAVHVDHQGRGLGGWLLGEALALAVAAADLAAARAVVLDAIDQQAIGFYRRFGFAPLPSQPLKLWLPMKRVRASLEAARNE